MPADLIDGKAVAARLRAELAADVATFRNATGVTPQLAAVLVGDDPASAVYVRNKHQACEQVGLASQVLRLPATTPQHELLAAVQRLNRDPSVHGILVQLPLPAGLAATPILDAIDPRKDVDCFHPDNVGRLCQGRPRFLPCTPHGVLVLVQDAGVTLAGAHVVVLGRSDIVGRPLAMMLGQKGIDATVTLAHSRTTDLPALTRTADIVIAAIGQPERVTAEWIRPGAVVIDVGVNRRADGRLVGDVAFEPVREVASRITPVPGGVGPMTIAMLLGNTLTAARQQVPARA
jgi:methylenetetrahydrofolate dehydrogenase (NADP+)/methenyltetrahydrofolate cyclohydrolase